MSPSPSLEHIMQIGTGFWASKTLLSAVELELFTVLAREPSDAATLIQKLGLHPRSAHDFLDTLVALNFLERNDGVYSNSADTAFFLDKDKPSYAGGILEMANGRLYGFWSSLTEALKTGKPQNEAKLGENAFDTLYSNPARLELFLSGMTGISMGAAVRIAADFPWHKYKTFADVGCAQGASPVQLALKNPHLRGVGFDLPIVQPIFEKYVAANKLQERLRFQEGDFFKNPLPSTDVLVMGHILHDWDLPTKKMLIAKAFHALPAGGALIVYEALIDDDRRKNAFGLLMSLNMLIETSGGFDFTGYDCQAWMRETGFSQTSVQHLVGPDSMVIGIK
ncbi:MAG: O-methyltransferase family 2 [Verrucomicrobiales bacterium]|nr:O-methyltransferase family 2 [Verrucomicrobiales bacterium]